MESLDPRLNRVDLEKYTGLSQKETLDQFETYEVFVQVKENKPFEHEGIVHAPNEDMAFLFGKEQFSRRGSCTGLSVVNTANIMVSPLTDNAISVYDVFTPSVELKGDAEKYEVFHLIKRGKKHKHIGHVEADSYEQAYITASETYNEGKPVLNVWVVKTQDILFSDDENKDIWNTLSEKQFRDAIAYRALDKIKKFKAEQAGS